MPNLIIPVGIPGCGKSTFASRFLSDSVQVFSTDAIRAEPAFGNDVNNQSNNDAVFVEFHRRIIDALTRLGSDVYADATNLTVRARQGLVANVHHAIALRPEADYEVHVVLFENCVQALQRNQARTERVVPAHVMMRMLEQYERAQYDLRDEAVLYTTTTKIGSM